MLYSIYGKEDQEGKSTVNAMTMKETKWKNKNSRNPVETKCIDVYL